MEMDETELRSLRRKAWSLVDRISDEMENEEISVCKHCSEHGLLCESPEKQRWIAIKDSLKDVDNMLALLQRLQWRQSQQCREAFRKLENSRMHLMAKIKHFQQHEGGQLDVMEELNAFFRKDNNKLKAEGTGRGWVFGLFNPWNWHTTAKTALKIALISVSVSSTYKLCQSGQEDKCLDSNFDFLANSPWDVSYGKG